MFLQLQDLPEAYFCPSCDSFWIFSLEQGAAKDSVEPSTTGATRASAITPAWLTTSAAMITSPSAPPVRLLSPHGRGDGAERPAGPYNRQNTPDLRFEPRFVCDRKLVQGSLRGALQEGPEVQLRPRLPGVQAVLLRLPNLLRCCRWA